MGETRRRGETLRGGGGERRGRLEERGGERGDDEGRRGWNVGYRRRCVHGDEFARFERDSKSPGKESSVSEDTDYKLPERETVTERVFREMRKDAERIVGVRMQFGES